jgi:hypothetical protein
MSTSIELGDTIEVEIGKGGRGAPGCGDGADGYALFVTHLALEPPYTEHVSYGQRVDVTQALADGAMIVCHGGGGSGGSGRA